MNLSRNSSSFFYGKSREFPSRPFFQLKGTLHVLIHSLINGQKIFVDFLYVSIGTIAGWVNNG